MTDYNLSQVTAIPISLGTSEISDNKVILSYYFFARIVSKYNERTSLEYNIRIGECSQGRRRLVKKEVKTNLLDFAYHQKSGSNLRF